MLTSPSLRTLTAAPERRRAARNAREQLTGAKRLRYIIHSTHIESRDRGIFIVRCSHEDHRHLGCDVTAAAHTANPLPWARETSSSARSKNLFTKKGERIILSCADGYLVPLADEKISERTRQTGIVLDEQNTHVNPVPVKKTRHIRFILSCGAIDAHYRSVIRVGRRSDRAPRCDEGAKATPPAQPTTHRGGKPLVVGRISLAFDGFIENPAGVIKLRFSSVDAPR